MDDDVLTPAECEKINDAIEKSLNELRGLLNLEEAKVVELDQGRLGRVSRIDAIQHQELAKSRERQARLRYEKIEKVQKRLQQSPDFFGFCESCDLRIPLGRLLLKPEALYCVPCLSEV